MLIGKLSKSLHSRVQVSLSYLQLKMLLKTHKNSLKTRQGSQKGPHKPLKKKKKTSDRPQGHIKNQKDNTKLKAPPLDRATFTS